MFVRRSARAGVTAEAPSFRERVRRLGRATRAGVFLVFALLALTMATPGTASADFACQFTGDDAYEMDSPGANGEAVFPAVNQWQRESERAKNLSDNTGMVTGAVKMPRSPELYTMYELNGVRGMNWSGTQRDRGDASQTDSRWDASGADDCEIMDYVNNGIANIVFDGTKVITRISISTKEFASNPNPLSGLYEGRDSVVETLKKNVLVPAVPVMITLTGLWVFARWRKGEMREAWSGVGWAALTTVAVVALLTGGNYAKVINEADSGIAKVNSLLTEAVLSGVSGRMQSPCDLPQEEHNRGMRISSCAMYDTLAFRPWSLGQFGQLGTNCIFRNDGGKVVNGECLPADPGRTCSYGKGARCEDLRVRQLVSQSMTNKDVFSGDDFDKRKDEWYPVRQDIAGGKGDNESHGDKHVYPVAFDEWAGRDAGNRIGLAFYSLIAALIVGLMVIVLSALTLLWHAVTLIMIILLPLIATLGIHPSQQKLLKGWLETFIHSFVLRAGFGVILTVLLVLYQMILPAKIALGMQLLMLLLVTVAVVMMLKKLLSGNFSPKIAGAQDGLGIADMANTVGGKLAQYTPGVAGGSAAAAGRATGRVAGKGAAAAGRSTAVAGKAGIRFADSKANKGRLQKGGWIATPVTKREERKRTQQNEELRQNQYDQLQAGKQQEAAASDGPGNGAPDPGRRRSGRVSANAPTPAPQSRPDTSRLGASEPAPVAPQPTATPPSTPPRAAPRPSAGRIQAPEPDPAPARQRPRPPAPRTDPRAQPQPPQVPPPPAPRRDDRMPR
ncbi:hypothetical protein [Streptomyces sp. NPDC006879]|uniref:hypothetical protein n=1 Tax=Streptomyces sp. NPDC006879 TaxID=3364767 RepID=UPI0036C0571A